MDAASASFLLEDLINGDFEQDILQEIMRIACEDETAQEPHPPPPPQQERQQHPPPQQQQEPEQEWQQQQDEKVEENVDAKFLEELRRSAGEADMYKSSRQLLQELRYLLGEEVMSS